MRLSHLLPILILAIFPRGKAIELINQIYEISKSESVPPDQLPDYIKQKLEEKQKIDEQIKEANAMLQIKNVRAKAINEHIKLKKELEKHELSTDNIHKLLNVLINAKRYGFDGKEIAEKLYDFKFLEWKEKEFKDKSKKLSKKISKHKDVVPFTEEIVSLGIGINELLAFKVGIKQASKMYNLPFVSTTLRLIDDIKSFNKINDLKKEVTTLSLQKRALDQACSCQSRGIMALLNLQSHGISEERILYLNNFVEKNGHNIDMGSL